MSHFISKVCLVIIVLLPIASVHAGGQPEACTTACKTPYGQILGTTAHGITAYSNCRAQCVIFEPNRYQGTYTGIKWQCVEFARRWLLRRHGVVYGDVDIAADIWDKINFFTRVVDAKQIPVSAHTNGSSRAPKVGDLLIYAKALWGTGHVAVILEIDPDAGVLRVAEQNFANKPWDSEYARDIPFINKAGHIWVLDAYLLGWKSLTVQ